MQKDPIAVTLCENLRTASYIPFYLAHNAGYWRNAGLDVKLWTAPDPSETAEALLDGSVSVSWGGPMRVMMHHDKDRNCPLVCFAQVVARDPFVLVGREPNLNFQFHDLVGPRIAITSEVPTPWMLLQEDLYRCGIEPSTLNRTADRCMGDNTNALRTGSVDVVQAFEPFADDLVAPGHGYVWYRAAVRGDVAFTSFYTTSDFIEKNREACIRLVRGINMALTGVQNLPTIDVASAVAPFFPDRLEASLVRIIENYRASHIWASSPSLPAHSFVRLKGALLSGGFINYDVPYEHVIDQALSSREPK